MKMKSKSLVALLLVLGMSLGLAACGGTGQSDKDNASKSDPEVTPEYVYVAEFDKFVEDTDKYINVQEFTDDGFYATSWEKVGENIPEGVTPQYEGQYDVYSTFLYFVDDSGKLNKLENYVPIQPEENTEGYKDFSSGSSLSGMVLSSDGSIAAIEYKYTSWYEGPDNIDRNSEEYWQYQKYSQKYFLRWLESDGTERSIVEISVNPDEYLDASRMKLDDKGNIVVATGTGLRAIASDGKESYFAQSDGYIDTIVQLPDGRIAAMMWNDAEQKQLLSVVDTSTGAFTDSYPATFNSTNMTTGNSQYDLFYTSGTNFYGYNIDEEAPVKLFNWLSCDVNGESMYKIKVSDDGVLTGVINNWDSTTETFSYEKVTIKRMPYDSVPHKEIISMAALRLDYNVLNQIIAFNRDNDKYRIEVTDYSEYNNNTQASVARATMGSSPVNPNENAGQTKLNTEIMAGNVPDIFCLSGLNYNQLASKGLLEDLYPFIDADKELSREDFFQNVFSAMEVDGKLCATVSNFYINTVLGASAIVGDEPGWTYDEFNAALASMPEGCTAFDTYVTKNDILQNCLALDMDDFVNWGSGQCSFDSQQFIDLLEFANQFPSSFDWENHEWSEEESVVNRLSQGKQMLVQTSYYNLQDVLYNNYTQYMGGAVTYIGFPTSNGTGNMLGVTDGGFAMSSKSQYKDVIWEFMRSFFKADYQKSMWGLPSNRAVFEEQANKAMTIEYQKDASGNILLDEQGEKIPIARYSVWNEDTGESEDIYAMTEEQVQQVRDLISTTSKVADYNSSIFGIVNEQVSAYFEGQKTAQDVAKLIQSKANIFVNEQR